MIDITSFMQFFIDSVLSILSTVYGYLSNIQFKGVSLLSFIIALFVLSAAIPIIVSIVSGGYSTAKSNYKRSRSRSGRSSEGGSDE